jgi:hypothetical protein
MKAAPEQDSVFKKFAWHEIGLIVILGVYCAVLVVGPLIFLLQNFDGLLDAKETDEVRLLELVVAMGVMGSALRGMAGLLADVGNRKFDPSWSLSYFVRPLEGAGIAVVVYLASRAGVDFLNLGESMPNQLGYLFIAACAGMFSHKAVDALRNRFVGPNTGTGSGRREPVPSAPRRMK